MKTTILLLTLAALSFTGCATHSPCKKKESDCSGEKKCSKHSEHCDKMKKAS